MEDPFAMPHQYLNCSIPKRGGQKNHQCITQSRGFRGSHGFQCENETPSFETPLFQHSDLLVTSKIAQSDRTAVAAIHLQMRMRILTRPENSLAKFNHQISNKKLRIKRCEGIRLRMRMFLRMKYENFVLAVEIPCKSSFATKFASDCECDGLVHSVPNGIYETVYEIWSLKSAVFRLRALPWPWFPSLKLVKDRVAPVFGLLSVRAWNGSEGSSCRFPRLLWAKGFLCVYHSNFLDYTFPFYFWGN